MDEKDVNNEPVTENDYDLFYGFVDSVFEEKKQFEDGTKAKSESIAVTEADWVAPAEPFEEFIVGMSQQDSAKYYTLNIISPESGLTSDIHPNHYGTISGLIVSITMSIIFLFGLYFFITEPEPVAEIVSNSQLNNIAESLNAVENKVQVIKTLESQVKAMVTQLGQLNTTITTRTKEIKAIPIAVNGPWVVNLASFLSMTRAETMLAEFHSLGISAELFSVTVKGKEWVRIRVPGFRSRFEAEQKIIEFGKVTSPKSFWVAHR